MQRVTPACAPCKTAAPNSLLFPKIIEQRIEKARIPVQIQLIIINMPPFEQSMQLKYGHDNKNATIFHKKLKKMFDIIVKTHYNYGDKFHYAFTVIGLE